MHSRVWAVLAVAVVTVSLAGCSSPLDVSEAERAAAATCEVLQPLPGVASASCVVDDGGFDAGISRDTSVTLEAGVTAQEAHRVMTTWLASKDGGFDEYEVSGSRATSLRLTLTANEDASFSLAPGTPPTGVAFVEEWLSRAQRGMPISASAGDGRTIHVPNEGLSPAAQANLLDEFAMQTRTDGLTLAIGDGSTVESPVSASLSATLHALDASYLGFVASDPDHELELDVDVFTGSPPRLRFRIPTGMAPSIPPDRALTETSGWPAIRTVLEAATPGEEPYTVALTAVPGQVIGGFSTSGCTPELTGPEPQFGGELQAQWAQIHGIPRPETCPR
ncbi:hypothetical protein [Microbacterium sp. MYb72]|uniref:hypothetical protein n=1 Tax=Microbacterium sp. MYb72 TaxID=1848693 RepID=UPI0011B030AD|nr:hypothetical protein [Microbacterium sp. MYb72]